MAAKSSLESHPDSKAGDDNVSNTVKSKRTLKDLMDGFSEYGPQDAIVSFVKNGSVTLNYQGFLAEIRSVAAALLSQEINQGDNVVFFAPNSASWIISALATIYTGATVVPIDSQQNDDVIKHILEDSSAGWIFTDEKGSKRLDKILPKSGAKAKSKHRLVRLDNDEIAESWKKIAGEDEASQKKAQAINPQLLKLDASNTAVLFYTSGTTGTPKGVPLTHTNMLLQLDEVISKIDLLKPKDRVMLPLPLFHVYPLNTGLMAPLLMGLTIVLPRSLTGPEIMRALNDGKVTVIVGVPRLLRSLYQAIESKFHKNEIVGAGFDAAINYCVGMDRFFNLRPGKVMFAAVRNKFGPTLRLFTCGGAPLASELAYKLRAIGWEIGVGYGLTETAPLVTFRVPEDRDLEGVGEPIKGVQVRIDPLAEPDERLDKDAGEIVVNGPNVFSGYKNLPDLNKEAFTSDGWFRTGDLGVMKNGKLHVIGRASSTIVMEGGEKIQPEDVEDRIAKQPAIAEIGLLQVDHKLVALVMPDMKVVGEQDAKAAVASALKVASGSLASYLQVTNFAVTKETLPRTNLGKIKRHELRARYDAALAEEKGGKSKSKKGADSAGAQTLDSNDQILVEDPAAAACLKWLKERFPEQDITLDTSPQLDLNIDSLEWMHLTLELVEHTGVELTGEAVARVTTVRELLSEIVASAEGGEGAVSPIDDPDHYLTVEQKEFVQPLTGWRIGAADALYQFTMMVMSPFRVEAVHPENIKDVPQLVFVPNHASYIDAFVIAAALPKERVKNTQWAGWTGIAFGNPVFSFLSRLSRVIPIEAKQSIFSSLALSVSVLKQGNNLVWFPEAERTLDGRLLPFKQGIGLLLEKSEVKAVPVYLDGTRQALAPGAFFPSYVPIRVIFGEPATGKELAKEGKGKEAPERIANALQQRVFALSQEAVNKPPEPESKK
ncbi:MAG: AMP-binding protein [Candidatus Obscuribacterales bacterium]|jgi:long-chain acyl-CoA synthetase